MTDEELEALVAVEMAIDWNMPITEKERKLYDEYIKRKKEALTNKNISQ